MQLEHYLILVLTCSLCDADTTEPAVESSTVQMIHLLDHRFLLDIKTAKYCSLSLFTVCR